MNSKLLYFIFRNILFHNKVIITAAKAKGAYTGTAGIIRRINPRTNIRVKVKRRLFYG